MGDIIDITPGRGCRVNWMYQGGNTWIQFFVLVGSTIEVLEVEKFRLLIAKEGR